MIELVLKTVFKLLPLLFAFGFLVPVIMQGMEAAGLSAPFGLSTLVFALVIGGTLGVAAQLRGRWI